MGPTSQEELPRLGRYQVINKIAAGGMAEVFLAKAVGAMGFQRLVAIKLIHANFTRDQEFVKMFIDEARIAMHLHHRNIVQVFDLDRANDTYFIAMEFVHGVNLYDLYERIASKGRWIEPSMALYLVAELSKGLHFAHTRKGTDGRPLGIVHRDISPQNILLSFEGEVKITDFGIATAAERLHQTAAGIVKGKYAYMAPERLQEQPTDGRVDVFSAGVLLYELLVGENPFAGSSAVDTIENVLNKKIAPPSERGAPVTQHLDRITLKALARDPRDRYATAQDLADALTEYALELTTARKDMAAGDGALAALLGELFPEKAKRPPGVTTDPKSISLPGLTGVSSANVQPVDPASLGVKPARGAPDSGPAIPEAELHPQHPQHPPKRNGRANPDLLRTQEDDPAEISQPMYRDPADELPAPEDPDSEFEPTVGAAPDGMDEPTILRLTPMSERKDLMPKVSVPKVNAKPMAIPRARYQTREGDEEFTDRELKHPPDESGFTTLPPYPSYPSGIDDTGSGSVNADTDRGLQALLDTPITPMSEEAVDKTMPTEVPPSMLPPGRRPVVSAISRPTDPGLDSDPHLEDAFSTTMQSQSGLSTVAEEESPPGLLVQPVPPGPSIPSAPVPLPVAPSLPSGMSAPPTRPVYGGPPQYRPTNTPSHGQIVQPASPSMQQPAAFTSPTPNRLAPLPRMTADAILGSEPGVVSNPLVVPVPGTSPGMEPSYPVPSAPPGQRSLRTTTIIAILLFIIAILVVFAAVMVVRDRERTGPARSQPITLRVTTSPAGAKVTIDGLEQQSITPYSGPVAANEDHLIGVSLVGYADPQVKKIRPPEGMAAQVHFDLTPLRGSIALQVTPPEAVVFINNQEKGSGNVTVSDLALGTEILVRVEAKGYKTIEQKITLEAEMRDITMPLVLTKGKNATVPPKPDEKKPPPTEGKLRHVQLVAPFGSWATIYYKNRWLGTTPTPRVQLPTGEVQLRVVNEQQKLDKVLTVMIPDSGPDQITLDIK